MLHWYGDVFCGLLRLVDCWRCIALVQNFRFWLVLVKRNDVRIYFIVMLFRKNLLVCLFLCSTFFTMPDGKTFVLRFISWLGKYTFWTLAQKVIMNLVPFNIIMGAFKLLNYFLSNVFFLSLLAFPINTKRYTTFTTVLISNGCCYFNMMESVGYIFVNINIF